MTRYLLDVNVLIALVDAAHVHHELAHDWFARQGSLAWASCPLTQNGLLRIVGHARYPNAGGTPSAIMHTLNSLCALPGHAFWADDISLTDSRYVDSERLYSSGQVTDTYLLALAQAHGGKLASFDRKLLVDAVHGGAQALHLI